jgi:hypothetical protein
MSERQVSVPDRVRKELYASPQVERPSPGVIIVDDMDEDDYDDDEEEEEWQEDDDDGDSHVQQHSDSGKRQRTRGSAPLSDKKIICPKNSHIVYVMPGAVADGVIPSYHNLSKDTTTRQFCNRHGLRCRTCKEVVSKQKAVTCAYYVCKKSYCVLDGVGILEKPAGLWFCTDGCREAVERPVITGYVQPFCSQQFVKKGKDNKGKEYPTPKQNWLICKDCMMNVCITCASTCHAGHELGPRDLTTGGTYGRASCRCGELGCCQRNATPGSRQILAAFIERDALQTEAETIPALIRACIDEEAAAEQTKAQLLSRMQNFHADMDQQRLQLTKLHEQTASVLGARTGLTMTALADLLNPLGAVVESIAQLGAAQDALPAELAVLESRLLVIKQRNQQLVNRAAEVQAKKNSLSLLIKQNLSPYKGGLP